MAEHRIFAMPFAKVYPLYVQKAERKDRTKEEVEKIKEGKGAGFGFNAGTGEYIDLVKAGIIDAAMEACEFPRDRVVVNLDRFGNSSAASVPLAWDEAVRDGRINPGDTVLLVAFGGGLTWGSSLWQM